MEFAVRQSSPRPLRVANTRRCAACHETALLLERRHVSPERWGNPVVTEFYECDCCDAKYAYSPADDRWRRLPA